MERNSTSPTTGTNIAESRGRYRYLIPAPITSNEGSPAKEPHLRYSLRRTESRPMYSIPLEPDFCSLSTLRPAQFLHQSVPPETFSIRSEWSATRAPRKYTLQIRKFIWVCEGGGRGHSSENS